MSNITLNIVEPGSSTPIEPAVPSTGLFTNGIGSTEAAIIGVALVALLAIVSISIYIYIYIYIYIGSTNKQNSLVR